LDLVGDRGDSLRQRLGGHRGNTLRGAVCVVQHRRCLAWEVRPLLLVEEMTRKGVLLAAGGLDPEGTRVTSSGGKITVTDGPFAEAKETILSFALVEARSKEEALELAKRFWQIVGNGEGAIRQVYGPE
jgi:hypothetical protein